MQTSNGKSTTGTWVRGALAAGLSIWPLACDNKPTEGTTAPADETADTTPEKPKPAFEMSNGELVRPTGYREWVFVGEPATPNQMNRGKAAFPELHNVYIDPGSYEAFRTTGKFPDGTILVKELLSVGATHASSGNGIFQGDFVGLEATIKSTEHFPDEPGNWAYFSFTNPSGGKLSSKAKPFATADCNACHASNADTDFVFTQHYPVLRGAKDEERAKEGALYELGDDKVLQRPVGYREWPLAGVPLTPHDLNGGKASFPEFHNVYIDPESFAHLEKTGEFRDGTILIKELVSVGTKSASSGQGYFQGEFIGLEATIKSAKHFPDEPGNWAYYSFTAEGGGTPKPTAEPFPSSACNECHKTNAANDFVFTQYYPVLRAAMATAKGERLDADNQWQPTVARPEKVGDIPLERVALHAWLRGKSYQKTFAAHESATHDGRGPHVSVGSPVKVHYNDVLAASLEAGNNEHPKGSVVVKEMFTGTELSGWAVMAKTGASSEGGKGWFWYETTSITDDGAVPAAGNGIPGCIGCHKINAQDLILSGWPLK